MAKTNTYTFPRKIFSVDFSGFICLSNEDSYTGKNLLDAESVGHSQAQANGRRIAKRYNIHDDLIAGLKKAQGLIGGFRLKKEVTTQEIWEQIEQLLKQAEQK